MTEAAAEHLPHGGVVVLIRQAAHLKALVIALFRLAVLEDCHGGDDVRPRDVRDIIGLEAAWRFAQTEHALQQHERAAQALCLRGSALGLLAGILLRQLHEPAAIAALRRADEHMLAELLQQKLLEQRGIVHLRREENAARRGLARQIVLLDERRQRVVRLLRHRQDLIVLIHQIALDKVQHCKAGLRLRLVPADDVGVRHRARRDELLLPEQLNGAQTVAVFRRALKAQLLGCSLHLLLQLLTQALVLALKQEDGLLQPRVIVRLLHAGPAPPIAAVHLIIQAGPLLADIAWEFLGAARQAERRTQGVDDLLCAPSAAVGAEIARAVVRDARGQRDDGIGLAQVDAQVGIALVVLEQDVVFRHIVLDERALQHKRLELRRRRDRLEMVDLRDHTPGLRRVRRGILKILRDPIFQFFGLSDIDHRVVRVLHQIDARLIGQRERCQLQFIACHDILA